MIMHNDRNQSIEQDKLDLVQYLKLIEKHPNHINLKFFKSSAYFLSKRIIKLEKKYLK